jgi:uncharacterized protein YyaL (SSP411 family)
MNDKISILLQSFASLLSLGITYGYLSLVTTMISVACTQFDKINAALLDIRQEHIMPLQDEQVHTFANCDLEAKLSACIRLHQDVME